jgi:hypothetical protein
MAYLGKSLDQLSDITNLDNISFTNSVGPYNLQKGSVNISNADTESVLICIDGVVQGGNYTVNSVNGTITFDFAVSSSSTCNWVKNLATGVELVPSDNSVTTTKVANDAITDAKIDTVAASKLTGALPAISGASLTNLPSETKPTITSTSLIIPPTTATSVTIAGTNFASSSTVVPIVEAINSTGGVTRASVVSWSSATSISATFNLALGDYRVRVENPDGNAVVSTNAILQASSAPTWTTSAGSLGSNTNASAISYTVAATSDSAVTYAKTSGTFPGGVSLNTSTGVISGTESGSSSTTTYTFQITPTDAETQAGPAREFTITISHGISGGGQFNG